MERKIGWNDLFLSGSVVDLDVGEWRARMKLRPKDLGIEDTEEVSKALALGSHRLAPKDAFDEIRKIFDKAKQAVEAHSLNFGLIRGARYVPDEKMASLLGKLRECRAMLEKSADEFAERAEEVKFGWLPSLLLALKEAAKTEEAAMSAYARILSEYPTRDEIRSKFYLRWRVYSVSGSKSRAASETIGEEAETVKSVVREMIEQLRGEVAEKIGTIIAAVARGGKIPEPTINAAREVIDRVESMNLFGDSVLSEITRKLRGVIDKAERDGKVYRSRKAGFLDELTGIQKEIDRSVEEAVAEAERNLTGLGRRKFSMSTGGA